MTIATEVERLPAAVPLAVASGVVLAGALDGWALGAGSSDQPAYWLAGIVAAVPVALVFGWWGAGRTIATALATVGALVFSLTLALADGRPGVPPPLLIGAAAIVAVGLVAVGLGRARPAAVFEALVLAWCGAAFIFEASMMLHAV